MKTGQSVTLCVILSAAHVVAARAQAGPAVLHIPRVSRPPALEDFLTSSNRQAEAAVSTFLQRAPRDGDAVSEATTAYLSHDERNLYVVFICKDDPSKTRARLSPRDNIDADDLVGIYLDTFHDRQRAYFFKINPLGVQADAIITEGQEADTSWDTVWSTRGRLLDDGYAVWAAIPFASLRFSNTAVQTWGIALTRYIQRNNEDAYWPYITDRVEGMVRNFATMDGLEGISSERSIELIPHAVYTGARVLDPDGPGGPAFSTHDDPSAGVDLKIILRDSLTLDVTVNPEFSQVESNDPQVTINRRFEVFFPEKRPFFLENAGFFGTPETLFFSRRILDPQGGLRLSGKAGRWAFAALAMDDRAPGWNRAFDDPLRNRRAFNAAGRVAREFANHSTIGLLATSRDFASSSNRVFAVDTRATLGTAWAMTAQVSGSDTRTLEGARRAGFAAAAEANRTGIHFGYTGKYLDRSPGFESELGFVQRVDIRETTHSVFYLWRPATARIVSYGPRFSAGGNWDRRGRTQDWSAEPGFNVELPGPTNASIAVTRSFERFEGLPFQKLNRTLSLSTDKWKWIGLAVTDQRGRGVHYYPSQALARSAAALPADYSDTSLALTLKLGSKLQLNETYFYSRLATIDGRAIFNSHTLRSKANHQFTRALSLRAIVDYDGVRPDEGLAALERTKRVTYDLLLAYLLTPGRAVYFGYTDTYENLARDQLSRALTRIAAPTTSTGRQVFIKASYLFRLRHR